jgi:glycosyltransferase involved in cell wall biosynthesis
MSMIKVLFIAHDSSLFGSNKSLLNLITGLNGRIKPIILVPDRGSVCDVLDNLNIKYYVFNYKYASASISILSIYKFLPLMLLNNFINSKVEKEIISLLAKEEIDLIHSNSSVITIGFNISRKLKIKHIWHLREFQDLDHNLYPFFGKKHLIRKIKKSEQVISISKCVANHFDVSETAAIIYNGVKSKNDGKIDHDKDNYFLFCGVLKRSKGISEAMKGFHAFQKENTNSKLLIAGVAPNKLYRFFLKYLVYKYDLKDKAIFLGFKKDMDSLMLKAKAVLMCSRNEAMGRVTAEAMFMGCPVIGYDNMGTSELIKDNDTGFLYSSIEELTEKMDFVMKNESSANRISENAQQEAIKRYSEESYSQSIYQIYASLTGALN